MNEPRAIVMDMVEPTASEKGTRAAVVVAGLCVGGAVLFFIGNDIQNERGDDTNVPEILVVAGQSYYVHSNGNRIHDLLGPDRWHLYHDVNYLIRVGASRILRAVNPREGATHGDWAPLVSRTRYLKGIRERSAIYLKDTTPFFERHWAHTRTTLVAMREFLRDRGIPLLIVLLPEHVQLDRDLQSEYLTAFGQSPDQYDFAKSQRLLRAWCEENGIPVLDLLPVFQAEANPGRLYFANDIHWTSEGHRLAAGDILPVL